MNMIDKDELLRQISNVPGEQIYRWTILGIIDAVPAVDPVKHGHWVIHEDDYYAPYITCSCCNADMVLMNEEQLQDLPKYCWQCGANMDEVVK